MPGLDEWLALARSASPDDLREHILTGFKSGKPFTPYLPTIDLPVPAGRVLDFGCGVGRSFPYLKTVATHVTGFDLPPMIERCRALAGDSADLLSDDWHDTRAGRFDLIYSALVLQHIEPSTCRSYLEDFARMAPQVYLLTRLQNDFGPHVFDLVADIGVYEADECVEVEHDADTHQLKVLGRGRFDDVRRERTEGHYEVLLRSKVFA